MGVGICLLWVLRLHVWHCIFALHMVLKALEICNTGGFWEYAPPPPLPKENLRSSCSKMTSVTNIQLCEKPKHEVPIVEDYFAKSLV